MQPAQAEHLRQLIDTSPVLQPAEKAEWADMLVLMNDKQAGELEQILAAHHATPVVAPTPPAPPMAPSPPRPAATSRTPASAMPSLSHISNLPSELSPVTRSPVATTPVVKVATAAMPWQKQFDNALQEKELPAPTPQLSPKPATSPVTARPSAQPVGTLETMADAGKLTPAVLRSMDTQDLLIRLQQLSKMEGYFNLLSYLEDSPLYKSYIATGKKVLANQRPFEQGAQTDPNLLSKMEFEALADILRKIQIN